MHNMVSGRLRPTERLVKDHEAPGKKSPLSWSFQDVLALLAVLIVFFFFFNI